MKSPTVLINNYLFSSPFCFSPDHQKLEREARICRLLNHANIGECGLDRVCVCARAFVDVCVCVCVLCRLDECLCVCVCVCVCVRETRPFVTQERWVS